MLARFMPILSGKARVAGVLGWPVAHSLSPRLHGYWLARYGIDGAYIPLPTPPERLADALRGLVAVGFAGANVTIPHKVAVGALCDALDATAARAGAVNTLVFRDGRILGSNTDGFGFLANLRAHGVAPNAGPALILGAGGAARAIAAALAEAGAAVRVASRRPEQAEALAATLHDARITPLAWANRNAFLADCALLVNATAAGMQGHEKLDIELMSARPELVVADIVYTPLETPLLQEARARGMRTVPGLGMLLFQAVPGFTQWFGVEPEVDEELHRFIAAALPAE